MVGCRLPKRRRINAWKSPAKASLTYATIAKLVEKLWHLRGLAATGVASNDEHARRVQRAAQLLLEACYRQGALCLPQFLDPIEFLLLLKVQIDENQLLELLMQFIIRIAGAATGIIQQRLLV